MSDDFRQNVGWSLPQSGAVSGRSHAVFGLEVARKSVSVGKTAGLTNPLNTEFRLLVHQTYSIIQTKIADEGGEPSMITALREGSTNAFLRQTGAFDERLTFKLRIEEKLLMLYEVTQIYVEVGVRELCRTVSQRLHRLHWLQLTIPFLIL